jgi:CRP/FNR family transcriptional regulator, cyclic AMP receptor protein
MTGEAINFGLLTRVAGAARLYKPGETIFERGDEGFELLVIKQGRIELRLDQRVLRTLETGEIFGEMALVDGSPRSAAAIAVTDVEVVPVSEKQFVYLVGEMPYFALNVIRVLAQRLRDETMKSNISP